MSELTLLIIKLGFLVLLWAFVLIVARVMRTDVYGVRAKAPKPARVPAAAKPPKSAKTPKPSKPVKSAASAMVITEGPLAGTSLLLGQAPVTIGRAPDNTLVIDDDYVSSHHARVYLANGGWVVEDLGSTNGTFVGQSRLAKPVSVLPGARIRLGRTVLELRK